jgi:pyruvate,orthophosphate dikinase
LVKKAKYHSPHTPHRPYAVLSIACSSNPFAHPFDLLVLLGVKGAKLCGLFRGGMPIPPVFIITSEACNEFLDKGAMRPLLADQLARAVAELEVQSEKSFGHGDRPLLLSVRSSPPLHMPGSCLNETVLNLGMNLGMLSTDRWALDTYRRFLQMWGTVVLGVDRARYDELLDAYRSRTDDHSTDDSHLSVAELATLVEEFRKFTFVPPDPLQQLRMAVEAMFRSWRSPLSQRYRDIHGICDTGTGVVVQAMVFGNRDRSGSGTAVTRNPFTGERETFGKYLCLSEVRPSPFSPALSSIWFYLVLSILVSLFYLS